MPAHLPLFQETFQAMLALTRPAKVRTTSVCRLALLVTGMIAARSCLLSRIAAELLALDLTGATQDESIQRRMRRTLSDPQVTGETCYEPILAQVIHWAQVRRAGQPVVLIVDESTHGDSVHLFRISLAYWGGALPLAWASWEQNVPQPDNAYWTQVDAVVQRVAALVPPDLEVIVLADRAFDIPPGGRSGGSGALLPPRTQLSLEDPGLIVQEGGMAGREHRGNLGGRLRRASGHAE